MSKAKAGDDSFASMNKFAESFRGLSFELIFILLKEDDIPIQYTFLMTLIQYLQILYFAFHPSLALVWNSNISIIFTQIFGYISVVYAYEQLDWQTYLVIFYIFVSILGVMVLCFVYCYLQLKRGKPIHPTIKMSTRILTNLFLSIVFIPFLYTFISIFNCHQSTNEKNEIKSYVYYSKDTVQCWEGMHIFHASCGGILSFMMIFIGFFLGLLYFNGIHNESCINSKKNNRFFLGMLVYESVLVISYNFLYNVGNSAIQILIFLLGGLVTFYMIHSQKPFNHPYVSKYWSLLTTMNMWTCIMLMMAFLVEQIIFRGIIFAWIIGLPLIIFIVLWSSIEKGSKDKQDQTTNVNKFQNADEVIEHCLYVQRLVLLEQSQQRTSQLLNGYIEFHNKTCLQEICPLKKVKFMSPLLLKQKGLLTQLDVKQKDKKYKFIYQMLQKIYEQGVAKFPLSIPLRIYYSIFLSVILKSKQLALTEIIDAENFKCTLDEKFILFYLRRNIENQIQESLNSDDEGQDYSDQKNNEGRLNQFKSQMEQTVSLLLEFWSQYSDDKPDLIKLYDIGNKLFPLKMQVEDIWKKLSRGKGESVTKVWRLYAKYQMDIFNDQVLGQQLLDKATKLENANLKKGNDMHFGSDMVITQEEEGLVFISMDEERIGQIININKSGVFFFGYYGNELINKNVNIIIPDIVSKIHTDILKKYRETNHLYIANQEKNFWGKNKNGYIFPMSLHIKPLYHKLKDVVEFYALINKDKSLKHMAYVICDMEGVITNISTQAISILGIDLRITVQQNLNIQTLFPDFFQDIEQMTTKAGKTVEYIIPKISDDFSVVFVKQGVKNMLYIQAQKIFIKQLEKDIGYAVKIELLIPKLKSEEKMRLRQKNSKQSNFENKILQFKFFIQENDVRVYGEFFQGQSYADIQDNSIYIQQENENHVENQALMLFNTDSNVVLIQSRREQMKQLEYQVIEDKQLFTLERKNWGDGYKVVRWINGNYFEVDKDESESENDEKQEQDVVERVSMSQQQKSIEEEIMEFHENGQHNSKDLNAELSKQIESVSIVHLKYFSLFFIISMVCIASIDYGFKIYFITLERQDLRQVVISSRQISQIQEIISVIRELTLTNQGVRVYQYSLTTGKPPNARDDLQKLQDILRTAIQYLEDLSIEISINQRLQPSVVDMYFDIDSNQKYDLNYATQQIISKSHSILNQNITEITNQNSDVFFVMYNGVNDYIKILLERYSMVNDFTVKNFIDLNNINDDILITSICVNIFFSLFLIVLLGRTVIAKQIILRIFFDIPEKTSKFLYQKCEKFLFQMNFEEDGESRSDDGIFMNQEEEKQKASIFGKKSKKFKNEGKGSARFIIQTIIITLFIEAYFILSFIINNQSTKTLNELLKEFNATTISESYNSLALNSEFQMVLNEKWTVFNEQPLDYIPIMIDTMYGIDSLIHSEHAKNTIEHNNTMNYIEEFDQIMFQDPCKIIVGQKGAGTNECEAFASGIVQQGMITVMVRFFQILRYVRDRLKWVNENPNTYFDFQAFNLTAMNFTDNIKIDNMLNMVRMTDTYEMISIQTQYQKVTFRYLEDKFFDEMIFLFDQYQVQRVLLLVIFIILMVFAFLLCWIPYLGQLNLEISSTKSLLGFIPVDEMSKIKVISQFIREIILERKI